MLAGETDEFKRLVLRHQARVYSLLFRQVGDREISQELAQDVFVRAFRGLSSFRFDSSFQTWLIRIALNVANSHFSSRRFREAQKTIAYENEKHEVGADEPDENGDDPARIERLRLALGELKPEFREPLLLCRIEKKTYAEVAELLGIPSGTVCSRINTAIAQLRKQITRRPR